MIVYEPEDFIEVLFRWRGSPLNGYAPRRAFVACFCALIASIFHHFLPIFQTTFLSTAFTNTLTISNVFIGLLISFRLNSAFQQWHSGVVAITAIAQAARNLMSQACAIVQLTRTNQEEKNQDKYAFLSELRRLVLLYIAIVFNDCRGNVSLNSVTKSCLLTEQEEEELHLCGVEDKQIRPSLSKSRRSVALHTPHRLRAAVVELWIRRLIQNGKMDSFYSIPESNALHASTSQLPVLFTTISNIAHIPIPFNYTQYLEICIVLYLSLYSCVIMPRSGFYTPIWVFLWGLVLFLGCAVAIEIECPFGKDDNDIDLEARLLRIEDELTVLLKSQYFHSGLNQKSDTEKSFLHNVDASNSSDHVIDTEKLFDDELSLSEEQRSLNGPTKKSMKGLVPQLDEYTSLMLKRVESKYLTLEAKEDSRKKDVLMNQTSFLNKH